jgi:uncharacterized protein
VIARRRFRRPLSGLLLVVWTAAATAALAGQADIPPSPTRWVTDTAGFLTRATADSLDGRLEDFERRTGRQVIVYIGRTTGDVSIEDWAAKAFAAWKVGRRGIEDGLILFLMAEDRRVRIEVGYGLEPVVTDLAASRIIRDILIPRLQSGDNDGAVTEAVTALLATASGEPSGEETPPSEGSRALKGGNTILAVIGVIFFIILFITNPRLAIWLLYVLMSGGRGGGGGGGFGGGGFRGGGGRSGGGGASGSW